MTVVIELTLRTTYNICMYLFIQQIFIKTQLYARQCLGIRDK